MTTLRETITTALAKEGRSLPPEVADKVEHAVTLWMDEKDHRLDQIIALSRAGMHPCLRRGTASIVQGADADAGWNLQLSPEAGQLIDFDGATLEDVLKEACAKYLFTKEATT